MFVNETHNASFNFNSTQTGTMPGGLALGNYLFGVTAWGNGGGGGATVTCADASAIHLDTAIGTNATIDWWMFPYSAGLTFVFNSTTNDWCSNQLLGYSGINGTLDFTPTKTPFSGSFTSPPKTFTFAGGAASANADQIVLWGLDPQNSDPWTYANGSGTPGTFTNLPGCPNGQGAQTGAQYFNAFAAGGATGSMSCVGTGTPSFIVTDYAGLYISAQAAGVPGIAIPVVAYSFVTA